MSRTVVVRVTGKSEPSLLIRRVREKIGDNLPVADEQRMIVFERQVIDLYSRAIDQRQSSSASQIEQTFQLTDGQIILKYQRPDRQSLLQKFLEIC